nr:hypothetical protein GCM10020241_46940 [Streptoalloteichus tenebrarius]
MTASTRTTACPAPGTGSGASPGTSASGPPNSFSHTARTDCSLQDRPGRVPSTVYRSVSLRFTVAERNAPVDVDWAM